MKDRPGRLIVSLPTELQETLKERAKAGYRSASSEALMLIERGLAAEKTAPEQVS